MMSLFFPLVFVSVLFMNTFSGVQGRKWKGEGTTQNLENIVIGRCYDYIRIVNPAVGKTPDRNDRDGVLKVPNLTALLERAALPFLPVCEGTQEGEPLTLWLSCGTEGNCLAHPPENRVVINYSSRIICGLSLAVLITQNWSEKNCSEIWEAFKNAFINKDPCSILPKDYELFINLSLHTIPPNKSLFWENNQLLVNSFAGRGRRYMSLGDTLFGFFGDFLNWCGQADSPGLDYESCPTTMECENNAVESFWRMASITYAQLSSGVIHVLLNGSADGGAYPQPGFFADYEIPNLPKSKISQIVIWVVDDIKGPDIDSCGIHSVKTLETRLKALGYDVTCTDNNKSVMFLLCLDNPDDSKCALASSAPAAQRGPISSDRGGSWNKLMFVSFVGFLFRFALVY